MGNHQNYGQFLLHYLFIFFHVKENEPKENARVPLNPARRRCDRSPRKLASLKQSARLFPVAPSMLGAAQRIKTQSLKSTFEPYEIAG